MKQVYQIENEIDRLKSLRCNINFVIDSLEIKKNFIIENSVPLDVKGEEGPVIDVKEDTQQLESRIYDFISEKCDVVEFDLKYGDKVPYRE